MRARNLPAGLALVLIAACSTPDADPVADHAPDERNASPDLALSPQPETVPVASDIEVNQPVPDPRPGPGHPSPERDVPQPAPEPIGSEMRGEHDAVPVVSVEPMPVASSHVHPNAPDESVSATAEEGGGKPTDVSTGLGPVPDRTWGDPGMMGEPGIMDDPNPMPGPMGRPGAVIIRGGAGGVGPVPTSWPSM